MPPTSVASGKTCRLEDDRRPPRRALGREKDNELTYGEVLFFPFYRLLADVVKPRPGEVFVDLGSGTGRAMFVAALCWPGLSCCKGYEVSPPLHSDAVRCHGELSGSVMAPVELHCADVLQRDDWRRTRSS